MSKIESSRQHKDVSQASDQIHEKQAQRFLVKFWGVRGLIPTPGKETNLYGGNTACVEMQVGKQNLIFDGGTGLRMLGKSWLQQKQEHLAHLFFTNSQTNRIQGFPFFAPAFVSQNCLHIYGSAASNGASIKQSLCDQMLLPHFPYPLQVMQSQLEFYNLIPDKMVTIDNVMVETGLINKIQKSIGYRVTWENYSVAYITDLQTRINELDEDSITRLIQGVNLMIVNPNYVNYNFSDPQTPIDSYWKSTVDLASKMNVKQLVFSNHHPNYNDDFLTRVQETLKSNSNEALLAHEGMVISVC